MISEQEVKSLAINLGVPLANVEKDYVMGWLLWSICNDHHLSNRLVLKGGNCLRKVYFPDARFSDDLDFTALRLDSENFFQARLTDLLLRVHDASGIKFELDRTLVQEKETPDRESKALDARVYFRGFAGDSSVTMRIKFDISEYERIILPTPRLPILHSYTDAHLCSVKVLTYSLEEVLAEKLRSWIQRTRSRDLFDVVKIVQSGKIPISKRQILSTFLQKSIFKGIPTAGRDELLNESKFNKIEDSWLQTIVCPINAYLAAANAVALFRDFIAALFEPEILDAVGESVQPIGGYLYNFQSGIRETIIDAGRGRHLIRMRYQNKDRDIEPYSFRFKRRKDGVGVEYFYGYDQTRGQTIKSFFLHEVQSVAILPQQFLPRFYVEF